MALKVLQSEGSFGDTGELSALLKNALAIKTVLAELTYQDASVSEIKTFKRQ
jgi:hypothetical protein